MKKIFILIFLSLFSFALPVYNFNYIPDSDFSKDNLKPVPVCPSGEVLIKIDSSSDSFNYGSHLISKDEYSGVNVNPVSAGWFSNNHILSNDHPVIFMYVNRFYSVNSGSYWDMRVDYTRYECAIGSCPVGQQWNPLQQKCEQKCAPNQRQATSYDLQPNGTCLDMCPVGATYNPFSILGLSFSFSTDPMLPYNCDDPNWDKSTCEAHASDGWKWHDNSNNFLDNFLDMLLYTGAPSPYNSQNYLPGGGRCFNTKYTRSFFFNDGGIAPSSETIIPSTFPRLPHNSTAMHDIPADLANLSINHSNLLSDFLDWLSKEPTSVTKTNKNQPYISNKNYDYIDTQIVPATSDKPSSYYPNFNETSAPENNGGTSLSSNSFREKVANNTTYTNTLNHLPTEPATATQYEVAYQTATKTAVDVQGIPDTSLSSLLKSDIGVEYPLVTTAPRNVSTTGGTQVSTIKSTLTDLVHNSDGTSTATFQGSLENVSYTVVKTFPSAGGSTGTYSTTVSTVSTNTNSDTGAEIKTNNKYQYSLSNESSTATITNNSTSNLPVSNSSSFPTTTTSNGTTTINPTISSSTNFYNSNTGAFLDQINNQEYKYTDYFKETDENYGKSMSDNISYLAGLKDNFTKLGNSFNDLFNSIKNLPNLKHKTGTCFITATWHGWSHSYDFCSFFAPYRSAIAGFLIILGMFNLSRFFLKIISSSN